MIKKKKMIVLMIIMYGHRHFPVYLCPFNDNEYCNRF